MTLLTDLQSRIEVHNTALFSASALAELAQQVGSLNHLTEIARWELLKQKQRKAALDVRHPWLP